MKGIFEEYGGIVIGALTAVIITSFLLFSIASPEGVFNMLVGEEIKSVGTECE